MSKLHCDRDWMPKRGDRASLVVTQTRMVHIVDRRSWNLVLMLCDAIGELRTSWTGVHVYPYVTRTDSPITCLLCLGEEHGPTETGSHQRR
jgi:hypothetical protein